MTQSKHKDKIYARPHGEIEPFRFDEQVAAVFPDMVNRSVPGYRAIIEGISIIAGEYVQARSHCYDLGCSLGAATVAMRGGIRSPGCHIFAVDNSTAMVSAAARLLDQRNDTASDVKVSLIESDILDVSISDASMVVLNYTLQFIAPELRFPLLKSIADNMRPGGVLVLSEKIRFNNPEQDETFIQLHHAFKRAQDYSDLEISQKRSALEDVLIPETLDEHIQRLKDAGFTQIQPWFQQLNFVSILATR